MPHRGGTGIKPLSDNLPHMGGTGTKPRSDKMPHRGGIGRYRDQAPDNLPHIGGIGRYKPLSDTQSIWAAKHSDGCPSQDRKVGHTMQRHHYFSVAKTVKNKAECEISQMSLVENVLLLQTQ